MSVRGEYEIEKMGAMLAARNTRKVLRVRSMKARLKSTSSLRTDDCLQTVVEPIKAQAYTRSGPCCIILTWYAVYCTA